MPNYSDLNKINRIIDANINRTKEGLRVCEEVTRFILNSSTLTVKLKKARHKIDAVVKGFPDCSLLIKQRQSEKDVGKDVYVNELKRSNVQDIFFANIQRVKESIRVLEEFSKLINKKLAVGFKKIRYEIYQIEKEVVQRLS